ncbi:MAG: hypothetical protein KR126chlam6_01386 [Candidatus Anoxychlamydiales bacterium]|nr:hypothetical protein [Candidatus Anoxychlamydiales bacterium]
MSFRGVSGDRPVERLRKGLSQTEGKKKPGKFSIKHSLKTLRASGTNIFECIAQGVKGFSWANRVTKGAVKPPKGSFPLPTNASVNRR